jgi:hypothetical protein
LSPKNPYFTNCDRRDRRGFDFISDALPFGRLCYQQVPDAIGYVKFYSRSHDAVIRVYDSPWQSDMHGRVMTLAATFTIVLACLCGTAARIAFASGNDQNQTP